MDTRGQLTKEERDAAIERGYAAERLLASPDWAVFSEHVQAQEAQNYFKVTQQPLVRMDDALPAEFAKGTLNGISLTLTLPARMVEEMRAILAEMETEE